MNEPFADLPDMLTPQDVADYLRRSRRRVYDLLNISPLHGGIKNFPSGIGPKSPRLIHKADFAEWIEARKREQENRFR